MDLKEVYNIIFNYRKAYKNFFYVLFMLYVKRKSSLVKNVNIKVLLKDKKKITVPYGFVVVYARLLNLKGINICDLKLTKNGLSFKYKELPIIIDPGRASDPDAVFFYEDYKFLNAKDRDVIDIGTNIGDSSIYFSINGANRVIGLEPYPYAFSLAERNVKLNGIKNIILLNSGYGKDSNVIVDQRKITSNQSSLIASIKGRNVSILSLKTLINKYNIKNAVLKMDCEGCEYAILNEDDEVFNRIEMIQLEYHYGYENLVKKLKNCGFCVKYTEPKKSYNADAENPNMYIGYIYAKK